MTSLRSCEQILTIVPSASPEIRSWHQIGVKEVAVGVKAHSEGDAEALPVEMIERIGRTVRSRS